MNELKLVIPGPPRTKKNSGRIVPRGKRHIILPSEAWQKWCDEVAPQLRIALLRSGLRPLAIPVNCAALFYRDAERLLKDASRPRVELVLTPIGE